MNRKRKPMVADVDAEAWKILRQHPELEVSASRRVFCTGQDQGFLTFKVGKPVLTIRRKQEP